MKNWLECFDASIHICLGILLSIENYSIDVCIDKNLAA